MPPFRERVAAVKSALRLLQRYAASSAVLFFGVGAQFAWFIIFARALGVEAFGHLMVIMAVTALAGTLTGVGCSEVIVRRVSRDRGDYPAMLGHGLILLGVTGGALTLISAGILQLFVTASPTGSANLAIMLAYSLSNILLASVVSFTEYAFLGFGDFRRANFINGAFSAIRVLTAVLACLVFGAHSIGVLAVWTLAAHAAAVLVCFRMLWPLGKPLWQVDRRELVLGFNHSLPPLADALRQNTDRIVLGMIASPAVLGNYATAARMAQTSQVVVNSLNRIMYPDFVRRAGNGARSLVPVAVRYGFGVAMLALATATGVYLIAPAIPWLVGDSYRDVIFDLRVLCWLIIPVAIRTVPYDLCGALDRHPMRAKVYNTLCLAGAALTATAVFLYGVTGAFVLAYVVQIALAAGLWIALLAMANAEKRQAAGAGAARRPAAGISQVEDQIG